MEKIAGKVKGSFVFVHNDYVYNKDHRSENIYRCNTRRTTRCCGAVMVLSDGTITLLKSHNHSKLFHTIQREKMKSDMLQLCRETLIPLKKIFDDICRQYPIAASTLSYNSIKAVLFRERQKSYPQVAPNLIAINDCIETHSIMDNITKIVITDEEGKAAILFTTGTLLNVLDTSHCIYADGIFSGVGTIFILCETLTKAMYIAIWSKIKELAPTLHENLKFTMTDYESAAMIALEQQFPLSSVKGCWFHYNQALLRKWRHLGLADAPTKVLSMAMTLALAPADLFKKGFAEIERESASFTAEHPPIKIFIEYIRSTWLPKAEKVSVYDCPMRTNNTTESYNNVVSLKLGRGKKNIWIFLETIKQLIMDEEIKLKRLNEGQCVRRKSNKKSVIRDNKIGLLQKHLASGRLTLKEFLLSFHKGHKILMYGDHEGAYKKCTKKRVNQELEDKDNLNVRGHAELLGKKAKFTNLKMPLVILEKLNI
ncbi:uncharacterized protein LOC143220293 isoform X2 [Lasioglossum baleicum]|uniref:uncharacterized protein LOC143220293 isoform X2 n=1 Tax=Lasioglossum baleicum TaxID=434251 RepID=UPI003FCD5994